MLWLASLSRLAGDASGNGPGFTEESAREHVSFPRRCRTLGRAACHDRRAWPGWPRGRPEWEERGRGDLAARAVALMAGGDPARASSRSGAPPRDGRRRGLLAAATVAVTALAAVGGAAAAVTLHGHHHRASPAGVQAAAAAPSFKAVANVTPAVAASTCTASTAFGYAGTVSAATAGTVRYQWVYSSGKPGPVQSVSFRAAGSVMVAKAETVTYY